MTVSDNPFTAQIESQGKEPSRAPARKRTFPATIGLRTFETEEDYMEALTEFLRGN